MIRIHTSDWKEAPKPAATDHLQIAIGDIHGRSDLLEPLMEALAKDCKHPGIDRVSCMFLGDLIDRGPDSLGVLGLVAGGLAAFVERGPEIEDIRILGNHDIWLRDALTGHLDSDGFEAWEANMGYETWASLGVHPAMEFGSALRERLPYFVQEAILTMTPMHQIGDYVYVHAGIDPRKPLELQEEATLTWIREAFLNPKEWPFDVFVVHGHTPEHPYEEPTVTKHRINLDTGAVYTGVLSAVEIRNDQYRFVQVIG